MYSSLNYVASLVNYNFKLILGKSFFLNRVDNIQVISVYREYNGQFKVMFSWIKR